MYKAFDRASKNLNSFGEIQKTFLNQDSIAVFACTSHQRYNIKYCMNLCGSERHTEFVCDVLSVMVGSTFPDHDVLVYSTV